MFDRAPDDPLRIVHIIIDTAVDRLQPLISMVLADHISRARMCDNQVNVMLQRFSPCVGIDKRDRESPWVIVCWDRDSGDINVVTALDIYGVRFEAAPASPLVAARMCFTEPLRSTRPKPVLQVTNSWTRWCRKNHEAWGETLRAWEVTDMKGIPLVEPHKLAVRITISDLPEAAEKGLKTTERQSADCRYVGFDMTVLKPVLVQRH